MNTQAVTSNVEDCSTIFKSDAEPVPKLNTQDFKIDPEALRLARERAEKAWADVPDSVAWVEQIRGNAPEN